MASKSRRKANRAHRPRALARSLARIEVPAALAEAPMYPEVKTAFDIFGSDLPDEAFAGVFDELRR